MNNILLLLNGLFLFACQNIGSENANFKYAELSQPVNLEGTHFNGDTDFKYTTIGGEEFVNYLLNAKIN
jgi:hypothetical protein